MTEYVEIVAALADGNKALSDLETYKAANDKLHKEVDRKEAVIVKALEQKTTCYTMADTLRAQVANLRSTVALHENTIKKLGTKPKTWGLGLMGGYGYGFGAEVKRTAFIGVGIYKTLLRF